MRQPFPALPPRSCEHCGEGFSKPYTESRLTFSKRRFCSQACKKSAQIGASTSKLGKKYRDNASRVPCRICGKPTRYHGTEMNSKFGLVHCGSDKCRKASAALKRTNQRRGYAMGLERGTAKPPQTTWRDVKIVSDAERTIEPWFVERGWSAQYDYTVGRTQHPRWFRFDFADPARKLYVEIDGRVHQKEERVARDARKDQIMKEKGWRCLRIPAPLVIGQFDVATLMVESWLKTLN